MARNKIKKKELIRFLLGGGSAVVVDFTTYQILLASGIALGPAKALSFLFGSFVGFLINKLWTFESKGFSQKEIIRYVLLYSGTAVINSAINKLTLLLISVSAAGFLCATGVSTVLNFLGQKYFVFHPESENK